MRYIPVASVIIGPEKDFLVGTLRRWRMNVRTRRVNKVIYMKIKGKLNLFVCFCIMNECR